jgi:2-oxoisovalerate dehydrogenase E1 component alpha subunit
MNEPLPTSLTWNNSTLPLTHQFAFVAGDALSIPTLQILKPDGRLHAAADMPELNAETALRMFDTCVFTQVFDERMLSCQRQGRISFYMTCVGEEGTVVGSAAGLHDQDMILGQYREHAALRYRGFTTEQFMNQLFSNEKDLGKGRQMPVHYGSKALHYQTISSPLATQIPQAVGVAFGQKIKQSEQVTLCYFGEGAASEGDCHAAMNMASVLKTPVIFFCRNNAYAISTPATEQYASDGIAVRAVGYGMPSIRVDGNDILAVLLAVQRARALALRTQTPVLIEAMTYRVGAHSSSDDPSGYRLAEEAEAWQALSAITRFKTWLIEKEWITQAQCDALYETYKVEVLAQVKQAEQVAKPVLRTMIEDVYAKPTSQLEQQYKQLKQHLSTSGLTTQPEEQ